MAVRTARERLVLADMSDDEGKALGFSHSTPLKMRLTSASLIGRPACALRLDIGGAISDDDAGTAGVEITAAMVLEASGEESLIQVKQLIMRDQGVAEFSYSCALGLSSLLSLSLSHNRVATLESFGSLGALEELNLNFNQIKSLDGLVAPNLTKLYLSSNRCAFVCWLRGFVVDAHDAAGDSRHDTLAARWPPPRASLKAGGREPGGSLRTLPEADRGVPLPEPAG